MSLKVRRRAAILELIRSGSFRRQESLRQSLLANGLACTQATLSRDLAELGVLKGAEGYIAPEDAGAAGGGAPLADALRRELLAASRGGSTVVLRTPAGHGNALAVELDRSRLPGMLGSIAGDDTVFIAAESSAAAERLLRRLRDLAGLAAR
jgi:transcriptional regulator of arginine metabolism